MAHESRDQVFQQCLFKLVQGSFYCEMSVLWFLRRSQEFAILLSPPGRLHLLSFLQISIFVFLNFIGVLPGVTRCRCKELECGSTPLKKGGGSVANGATRFLVFNNITSLFSFALINFGFERLKLPKFIR